MGEVILRALLDAAPPDRPVAVASFGTGDWHIGEGADPRTVAVLAAHGYDATAHRVRLVPQDLLMTTDLVLVADRSTLRRVGRRTLPGPAQVRLMREFDPASVTARTLKVKDPYYGTAEDYERCFVEVEASCRGLMASLPHLT
jgi:protein-tyrosine phosphatase